MSRVDKLARVPGVLLLALLLTGCLVPPVRESLRLEFRAEGGVLVTSEIRIASTKSFEGQERAQRRIEDARRDAGEEQDAWSRRLNRLEPPWDERTVEREEGQIVRVTRRSLLDDARELERLFGETDVDCELEAVEDWVELRFLPGISRRASGRQRELYEPLEQGWIRHAARYLSAMEELYDYLERRPERALICLAPLVRDMASEDELSTIPEPDETEQPLFAAAKEAADEMHGLFAVPEDAAFTVDELSSLVHDPFPAPVTLRVPGQILLVEGFVEHEGELQVRGPSLWNAWRAIGDEHLSPDLVRTRWQRGRSAGEEELSVSELASRPRFARGLDERELETLVRERLEPPALLRVRWSASGN